MGERIACPKSSFGLASAVVSFAAKGRPTNRGAGRPKVRSNVCPAPERRGRPRRKIQSRRRFGRPDGQSTPMKRPLIRRLPRGPRRSAGKAPDKSRPPAPVMRIASCDSPVFFILAAMRVRWPHPGDISGLLALLANLAHENSRQLSRVSASSRPAISFFSVQPEQLTASSRGASYPFGIPKSAASVEIPWPIRAITE